MPKDRAWATETRQTQIAADRTTIDLLVTRISLTSPSLAKKSKL